MPKINVYLPDELAAAVKDASLPVSAICQIALEQAVRAMSAAHASDTAPGTGDDQRGLFARFTPRARQAVSLAEAAARRQPHNYVGTEHILLGLLEVEGNLALRVFESLDIELDDIRAEVTGSMGPAVEAPEGHIPFTVLAKQALGMTATEALALGHNYIGCEHMLLGLLGTDEGVASKVLRRMGMELRTTRRTVTTLLSGFVQARSDIARTNERERATLDDIVRRLDSIEQRLAAT